MDKHNPNQQHTNSSTAHVFHSAHKVKICVLEWQSPDLDPIEMLWYDLIVGLCMQGFLGILMKNGPKFLLNIVQILFAATVNVWWR